METEHPDKPVVPRKPWLGIAGLVLALAPGATLVLMTVFQPG